MSKKLSSNNKGKGKENFGIDDVGTFFKGGYNSEINAPFESAYQKSADAISNIANATPDALKVGYNKTADALKSAYDYIEDNGKIEKVFGNSYTFNGRDSAENDINSDKYTLFHRFLYGGLCSGAVVIPTNALKIILTLIFPPIGTLLQIIGDALLDYFPYITWDTLMKIFQFENINKIIYTLVLTSMFYVPGLVYALAQLTKPNAGQRGTLQCDPNTGNCVELSTQPVPK